MVLTAIVSGAATYSAGKYFFKGAIEGSADILNNLKPQNLMEIHIELPMERKDILFRFIRLTKENEKCMN